MSSIEFQSPIAIKIPIEVDIAGEDQVEDAINDIVGGRGTKGTKQKKGLKGTLEKDLGAGKAREALSMLIDPQRYIARFVTSKNFLKKTGGTLGLKGGNLGKMAKAGGLIAAIWFVLNSRPFIERITQLMTKKGGIFDRTFRNNQNTLQNQFRTREQQQSIRSGFTQVIFTTNAGTTNPRDSYNTYEQTVHDEVELINLRNIRTPGNNVP